MANQSFFYVSIHMKIKEVETQLRPREKALTYGLESLSDMEIICLLLQSGNKERSVFDLAKEVLTISDDLSKLFDLTINDLVQIKGIKEVKALQLMTSIELCKRVMRKKNYSASIFDPVDLVNWFQTEIGYKAQEHFICVYLNVKGKIIGHKILFIGTLSESCVHPREIFHDAIQARAFSIIMVHNHPSGDPAPSRQDILFTRRVKEISQIVGIDLLDHVIVGKEEWYSFKQHQYLD